MITGQDFIQLASLWAAAANNEAMCRSSISRAYYGAYHITRTFLESDLQLKQFPRDQTHHKFPVALQKSGVDDAKAAGDILLDLREQRRNADYEITENRSCTKETARESVALADKVRTLLKSCSDDTMRDQMRENITRWREIQKI